MLPCSRYRATILAACAHVLASSLDVELLEGQLSESVTKVQVVSPSDRRRAQLLLYRHATMCGRYALYGPATLTEEARAVLEELDVDLEGQINQREDRFNIAPTQKALVLASGDEGLAFHAWRWGLVPFWAKDLSIGAKMINARSETVTEKPAFRAAFKKRRCLVPASGYFEWKVEPDGKQPYFIVAPGREILLFAGLWETWRNVDQELLHTFTVITGKPSKVSGDIHDRQPVILPPGSWSTWLTGRPDDAGTLIEECPEATLEYFPVPKAVGNPRNHGPELVEAIER